MAAAKEDVPPPPPPPAPAEKQRRLRAVMCSNPGCGNIMKPEGKETHEAACQYRPTSCPNEGCDARFLNKDRKDHEADCLHRIIKCKRVGCVEKVTTGARAEHEDTCGHRFLICVYPGCAQQWKAKDLPAHDAGCDHRPVACSNTGCKVIFKRKNKKIHLLECPFRVVTCGRAGCGQRFKAHEQTKHAMNGIHQALDQIEEIENPQLARDYETFAKAVEAMTANMHFLEVQRKACWTLALGAITYARHVLRAGGAEALVQAMHRYPADERLQREGVAALRAAAGSRAGARRVLEAQGLRAVTNALQFHREDLRVQEEGCGALKNFAQRDPAGVLKAGGLDSVTMIAEMVPPNFTWVHMWCAQALRSFAEIDAKRVEQANGFENMNELVKSNLRKKDDQKGSRLSKGKDYSEGLNWAGTELMKYKRFA